MAKTHYSPAIHDQQYADLLQAFSRVVGVDGRPFGQRNKSRFGLSDGNAGVQWNLAIDVDEEEVLLGVNLEGMKYQDWPIADFILRELNHSGLQSLKSKISEPSLVDLRFCRDAWQIASRLRIVEEFIGGRVFRLDELDDALWCAVLKEALACLDEQREYRGRAMMEVTLPESASRPERVVTRPVSPHLTVTTRVIPQRDLQASIRNAMDLLAPVYRWVSAP